MSDAETNYSGTEYLAHSALGVVKTESPSAKLSFCPLVVGYNLKISPVTYSCIFAVQNQSDSIFKLGLML